MLNKLKWGKSERENLWMMTSAVSAYSFWLHIARSENLTTLNSSCLKNLVTAA